MADQQDDPRGFETCGACGAIRTEDEGPCCEPAPPAGAPTDDRPAECLARLVPFCEMHPKCPCRHCVDVRRELHEKHIGMATNAHRDETPLPALAAPPMVPDAESVERFGRWWWNDGECVRINTVGDRGFIDTIRGEYARSRFLDEDFEGPCLTTAQLDAARAEARAAAFREAADGADAVATAIATTMVAASAVNELRAYARGLREKAEAT